MSKIQILLPAGYRYIAFVISFYFQSKEDFLGHAKWDSLAAIGIKDERLTITCLPTCLTGSTSNTSYLAK